MKAWIWIAAVVVAAGGCQTQPKSPAQQAARPSVLDVSGPSPAYTASATQPPVYLQPLAIAPIGPPPADPPPVKAPPVKAQSIKAPPPTSTAAAKPAGESYIVRKGDTLFHIAKDHYGNGNKWQQIAAANPGVTPTSLHVGQKLLMP